MADMLVKLYDIPKADIFVTECEKNGIQIRRAMAPDKFKVVEWVKQNSNINAAGECDVCFSRTPISCFVATKGKEIVGYACYNATALNFFGPTRVLNNEQGKGIGKALLLQSLESMRSEGYAYAIIGGIGPAEFYEKCVGAVLIPNSTKGIYKDFLGGM